MTSNEGQGIVSLHRRRTGRRAALTIAVGLLIVSGFVTATLLFVQYFPPVTSAPAIVVSQCPTLALTSEPPVEGSQGIVTFACSSTTAAFSVTRAGNATPQFSLDPSYVDNTDDDAFVLYIYPESYVYPQGTYSCMAYDPQAPQRGPIVGGQGHSWSIGLTSEVPWSFTSGDVGNWNYCLEYRNAPASFQGSTWISWAQ